MKMYHFADAGKINPIKTNFKGKKMLPRLTINGRLVKPNPFFSVVYNVFSSDCSR